MHIMYQLQSSYCSVFMDGLTYLRVLFPARALCWFARACIHLSLILVFGAPWTEGSPRAGRNSDSEAERLAQSARSSGSGTNLGLGLPLNPPKTKYGPHFWWILRIMLLASLANLDVPLC